MRIFNVSDVIHFAVRVEEDGEAFYRKAALLADDKEVGDLFRLLADEEVKHKAVFQGMLSSTDIVDPPETYGGEYMTYLHAYIDNKVVFSQKAFDDIASGAKAMLSAITFAMEREVDSILYYHEVKQFVAKSHQDIIDGIIIEERKHFGRLSELRQKRL